MARARTTALPIRFAATTPNLLRPSGGRSPQFKSRQPRARRRPAVFRRRKSRGCLSRWLAPSVNRVDAPAGMTGSHRGEALAAHAAAIGEDFSAAPGGHAGTETMLALTANFRRLILAFHRLKAFLRRSYRWRTNGPAKKRNAQGSEGRGGVKRCARFAPDLLTTRFRERRGARGKPLERRPSSLAPTRLGASRTLNYAARAKPS